MLQEIPFVGILLLAANIVVSLRGFKQDLFFDKYRFEVHKIQKGEYFRLLSSAFLHVNTTHLLFNMFTFYFFVSFVVSALGALPFVLLYFGSLLAGNLFAYAFHRNQPNYIAVGASGAVTGVLFSCLSHWYWQVYSYIATNNFSFYSIIPPLWCRVPFREDRGR
jgi:membrane associated rhomboid family serine protease